MEFATRASKIKRAFIAQLAGDLRFLGHRVWFRTYGRQIRGRIELTDHTTEGQRRVLRKVTARSLIKGRDFIRRIEATDVGGLFITGRSLNTDYIQPSLHICTTAEELAVHRYCRLFQGVPHGNRVGRQIYALVFDEGQERRVLMGAITLASSLMNIGCRDELLNWNGAVGKPKKRLGLRRIMDLATCVSVPPYDALRGGKLLAGLALSAAFQKEYNRKYGDPLLALATTCATGLHCPIFNRINLIPGGLYRRIGRTKGYTTSLFSGDLIKVAFELACYYCSSGSTDVDRWSHLRIIRFALGRCGINPEPVLRQGTQKGVYLGTVHPVHIRHLQRGTAPRRPHRIAVDRVIDYWKRTQLSRVVADRATRERLHRYRTVRSPLN